MATSTLDPGTMVWMRCSALHDVPTRWERNRDVTESARAHSYISSSQVQKTCEFWLSTFVSLKFWLLTVPSALRLKDGVKSVFPHYSVKKYRSPWFSR